MIDHYASELNFALEAVSQASKLIKGVQAEMVSPTLTKNDRSPVSVADYAAQALVARMLMHTYPHDPLVAEEDASTLQKPAEAEILARVTQFVGRYGEEGPPKLSARGSITVLRNWPHAFGLWTLSMAPKASCGEINLRSRWP